MRIQWFGQSAFLLSGGEKTVFIDPFGKMDGLSGRGMRWDYPAIEGITADLLLVTHEHGDHNGVEAIVGAPPSIRSTAGTFDSVIGKVTAIASEHDEVAGTQRGPNTIFVFALDGLRVCHFGDFGQIALRPEQRQAIGVVDLLFIPVGGMSTINGESAARIVGELRPRFTIPMHYRTPAIGFLEPADGFFAAMHAATIQHSPGSIVDSAAFPAGDESVVVVPAPPLAH